jgi:ribosomal protein L37AE/L43A
MAIVYKHIRLDTNEVFYIGIGSRKRRAYSDYKRSKHWHSVVNKVGYKVELLHEDIDWEKACEIEQELIKLYGRKDLGLGTLVNMTDGGDGRFGAKASDETKKKMSQSQKGLNTWTKGHIPTNETRQKISNVLKEHWKHNPKAPMTEEAKQKISRSLTGRPGTWVGKRHSEESLEKMKASHGRGENNKRYGQKNSIDTINKMRESAKNRERVECPHCKKYGEKNAMMRWHFDNCKTKKENICKSL